MSGDHWVKIVEMVCCTVLLLAFFYAVVLS
jgi:hypothetical protein